MFWARIALAGTVVRTKNRKNWNIDTKCVGGPFASVSSLARNL